MALTDKLTAIADGFRESRGTTNKLTLDEMAVLAAEPTGGGGDLPEEAYTISGPCSYKFCDGTWDWFIESYGNKVTTENITAADNMFKGTTVKEIPFTINVTDCTAFSGMFASSLLEVCPKIRGTFRQTNSITLDGMVGTCKYIRDFEDLFLADMFDFINTLTPTSAYSAFKVLNFYNCPSLRRVPSWWYKFRLNEASTVYPNNTIYGSTFGYCHAIDDITNVPVWKCAVAKTSNMFSNFVTRTCMLKRCTFETTDGQPIVADWKSQTLDLSNYVGYAQGGAEPYKNNSGVLEANRVTSSATYQALKNDPDWWTSLEAYSRYNHDSAVETINSLPDTSAYLASAGGTNTIKFKGASGSATDGGAINTLTAEEIAVATAKGWTVTLV